MFTYHWWSEDYAFKEISRKFAPLDGVLAEGNRLKDPVMYFQS